MGELKAKMFLGVLEEMAILIKSIVDVIKSSDERGCEKEANKETKLKRTKSSKVSMRPRCSSCGGYVRGRYDSPDGICSKCRGGTYKSVYGRKGAYKVTKLCGTCNKPMENSESRSCKKCSERVRAPQGARRKKIKITRAPIHPKDKFRQDPIVRGDGDAVCLRCNNRYWEKDNKHGVVNDRLVCGDCVTDMRRKEIFMVMTERPKPSI